MNPALQQFMDEIKHNEALRQEVNQAGRAITEQNSKELRMKLSSEMAEIASRHGFRLEPTDFYDHFPEATFPHHSFRTAH